MRLWLKNAAVLTMLAAAPGLAMAGSADGVWQTEKNDDGGWLEVTIAPCASDASKSCGTISGAHTASGPDPSYPDLGKLIVKDMSPDGTDGYSGGTIWDPEHDKTYDSEMTLKGDVLDVEGCISIICSGQDWKRLK